ncbi:MAG: hypothetical protein AB1512_10875 [Thermodesulfobacteriota bacterium]
MADDDSEQERRKEVFEKVSGAIEKDPRNWVANLGELGFQWFDDETDEEEIEEINATIGNDKQKLVVEYLEGGISPSEEVLSAYLAEKDSDSPNYPLFRKYFKRGNENLKRLLMLGLQRHPTDIGLLGDLAYFHEFGSILGELIQAYLRACESESEPDRFIELVTCFYLHTEPDGYDALRELEQIYGPGSAKWRFIQEVRKEFESAREPDAIRF